MLKKFSITIGVFFLLIVIMGIILPSEYNVERTIVINAKPEAIHPFVEDLQQWPKWTPWHNADSKVKITPGEIHKGLGASQQWAGNKGTGILEITKSSTDYGIDYFLDMKAESLNTEGKVTYQNQGDTTQVNWSTKGKFTLPIISPYIAMAMDGTAGPMLEQGLGKLKKLVEENEGSGTAD